MVGRQVKYKWANAYEWLSDYLDTVEDTHVFHFIIKELARKLDGDTLQDIFEDMMDVTGYFEPEEDDDELEDDDD